MAKIFNLLLLCATLTAPALHVTLADISCNQVVNSLIPCIDYLQNGGAVPPRCCGGVKTIYNEATTTANRQAICRCLTAAINGVSYTSQNVKNAQALPGKCGVNLPWKFTPQTKCEQVP